MSQNKRRFWKGVLIALVVLFVLAVAEHHRRKWRLEAYKAELLKQGMIFDLAKLVPPVPPEEENGATIFNEAMAQLDVVPLTNFLTATPLKYETPERARVEWRYRTHNLKEMLIAREQLVEVVERNQAVLENIRKAAQRPHMNFQLDFLQLYELELNHLPRLRRACGWLMVNVMIHLQERRVNEAITDMEAVLSLTSSLRDTPLIISKHYAHWTERDAMEITWGILQAEGLREADLSKLQTLWLKSDQGENMTAAVMMEQWMALESIRNARESTVFYDKYLDYLLPGVRKPFSHKLFDKFSFQALAIDMDWFIRDTAESITSAAKKFWWRYYASFDEERVICEWTDTTRKTLQALAHENNAHQILKDSELWERNAYVALPRIRFLDSSSYGMIFFAPDKVIATESIRRLAGTAVALKRYQLKHGEWPETLEVMVPEFLTTVPTDPGDGQPLRYRRQSGNEFLLYTLGDNGKDDGGEAVREDGTTVNPRFQVGNDWVWPMPVRATVEEQTTAP